MAQPLFEQGAGDEQCDAVAEDVLDVQVQQHGGKHPPPLALAKDQIAALAAQRDQGADGLRDARLEAERHLGHEDRGQQGDDAEADPGRAGQGVIVRRDDPLVRRVQGRGSGLCGL